MAEDIFVKNMLRDNSPTQEEVNDRQTALIAIPYDEFQRGTPRRAL